MRRSKRLSRDNEQPDGSPVKDVARDEKHKRRRQQQQQQHPEEPPPDATRVVDEKELIDKPNAAEPEVSNGNDIHQKENVPTHQEDHSATKIALPFADTPVIKRNKAMREGKAAKGERRSSLGLRGRRASSLIETGNSNGKISKRHFWSD